MVQVTTPDVPRQDYPETPRSIERGGVSGSGSPRKEPFSGCFGVSGYSNLTVENHEICELMERLGCTP